MIRHLLSESCCWHTDSVFVDAQGKAVQGDFNGFEVVICHEDQCYVYGDLYQKSDLIDSWKAVMTCGQTLCETNGGTCGTGPNKTH